MIIHHLHYTLQGTGNTVVFLHGFLEDSTMWAPYAAHLSKSYRVLCIDLLGHGKTISSAEVYTMEDQADIVKGMLEDNAIEQAVVIGHSMGGYVVLALAENHPSSLKGFSLFFSTAAADDEQKKEQRTRVAKLVLAQRNAFIDNAIPNLFHNPMQPQLQTSIAKAKEMAQQVSAANIAATVIGMRDRKDRRAVLKNEMPKQIFIGKYDPALDIETVYEQVRSANNLEYEVFETGHMGHYEAPALCLLSLEQFVAKCYK